jgi:hypothetical protein
MSSSKLAESESDVQILAKIYFRTKKHERKEGKWIVENNLEGYAWCLRCEDWVKDNSGHSNLVRHVQNRHPDWKSKLDEQKSGIRPTGGMDKYVKITKVISEEAKNMYGWLEWIVMADLPITIVENDYYIKRSNLLPTTYKTVTKYMDKLLILVKDYIKKCLPSSYGIIFDGWTCDSEHYIAIFATWTLSSGTVIKVA